MKLNLAILGALLTVAGLVWQGSAKLTRIEDTLTAEREARTIQLSHLQSWLDDTRDRLKTLEKTR